MKLRSGKVINTRAPYKKRAYRRRAKKVTPAVKSYVKRIISSNNENKMVIQYGINQAITTASATNPTYIQNLLPSLAQGTGKSNRIGNDIKIKYAYVRGFVNLLPYSATLNPLSTPIQVKIWLCSSKTVNTNNIASTSIASDFFEVNNASAGFQGNLLDMMLTPNKDSWVIHATKTFELGATYASTNGQVGTAGYFDNSKMIRPFYFNYGKYFKSVLKYNDQTLNIPTNKNLFLVFQAVNADGSTTAINCAEYHFTSRCEFEDA